MSEYAMDDDLYLFPLPCGEKKTTLRHTWVCTQQADHEPDQHWWESTS